MPEQHLQEKHIQEILAHAISIVRDPDEYGDVGDLACGVLAIYEELERTRREMNQNQSPVETKAQLCPDALWHNIERLTGLVDKLAQAVGTPMPMWEPEECPDDSVLVNVLSGCAREIEHRCVEIERVITVLQRARNSVGGALIDDCALKEAQR